MNLEWAVVRVSGAALLVALFTRIGAHLTGSPLLKSVSVYCFGFAVFVAALPLLLLAVVLVSEKKDK